VAWGENQQVAENENSALVWEKHTTLVFRADHGRLKKEGIGERLKNKVGCPTSYFTLMDNKVPAKKKGVMCYLVVFAFERGKLLKKNQKEHKLYRFKGLSIGVWPLVVSFRVPREKHS